MLTLLLVSLLQRPRKTNHGTTGAVGIKVAIGRVVSFSFCPVDSISPYEMPDHTVCDLLSSMYSINRRRQSLAMTNTMWQAGKPQAHSSSFSSLQRNHLYFTVCAWDSWARLENWARSGGSGGVNDPSLYCMHHCKMHKGQRRMSVITPSYCILCTFGDMERHSCMEWIGVSWIEVKFIIIWLEVVMDLRWTMCWLKRWSLQQNVLSSESISENKTNLESNSSLVFYASQIEDAW